MYILRFGSLYGVTYNGNGGQPNISFKWLQKYEKVHIFFFRLLHQQTDFEVHKRLTEVDIKLP